MIIRHFLIIISLVSSVLLSPQAQIDQPPTPAPPEVEKILSDAFAFRLNQLTPEEQPLTFALFTPELDSAFLSPDGTLAVIWLALRDPEGVLLASEPGMVLGRLEEDTWQVLLPGDPGWEETLAEMPPGMLPLEQSPIPENVDLMLNANPDAYTGYYLPYIAGTERWLEGSVSHFHYLPWLGYPSCSIETCRYAYDFTDAWHFPIVAAKAGVVYALRDSCPDGGENCTNFIVLHEPATGLYQLYLHLAYGTIPNDLAPGVAVARGEYIGDSDDTGYSTSQHVHFMVVNNIWVGGDGYYWGTSVDIRFADVSINNGIPRTCYEVTQLPIYDGATECLGNRNDPFDPDNDWFTSGNTGAYPPGGSLSRPAAGVSVALGDNPLMDVTAWPTDDVGITAVRLVAKIGGKWVEIGPMVTQPVEPGKYDWDVDLCAVGALNGPLEVALRAWDYEGNVSSALSPRTIIVEHACPFPASALNPAQTFDSTAVRLSWTVSGPAIPIGSFDLQWRPEPGSWSSTNMISYPGAQRSAWFVGNLGGSYAFRLRLWDTTGLSEYWPANNAAETSAVMPSSCTPDSSEPDDSSAEAKTLQLNVPAPRNLCGPGDPDWFKVDVTQPGTYLVHAESINGGAAVKIKVYNESLSTILAQASAPGIARNTIVAFRMAGTGRVYVKVEPLVSNLAGTGVGYRMNLYQGTDIFLPLIRK